MKARQNKVCYQAHGSFSSISISRSRLVHVFFVFHSFFISPEHFRLCDSMLGIPRCFPHFGQSRKTAWYGLFAPFSRSLSLCFDSMCERELEQRCVITGQEDYNHYTHSYIFCLNQNQWILTATNSWGITEEQYWLDSAICHKMHNNLKPLRQFCMLLCKYVGQSKESSMNHLCLVKPTLLYTFKGSLQTKAWSLVVISSGWRLSKPAVCRNGGNLLQVYCIFYQRKAWQNSIWACCDRSKLWKHFTVCLCDVV